MDFSLQRFPHNLLIKKPLLFVIMDGVGLYRGRTEGYPGNAVDVAHTPCLDQLFTKEPLFTKLQAHGAAVGLPSDSDQGNSEVGHNAIGAGRIFDQGAALVNQSLATGAIFSQGSVLATYVQQAIQEKKAVHFIGLLSDGNVHSHIRHLIALIQYCNQQGVERLYVHGLLDGRDVPPLSALQYFGQLEDVLWSITVSARKNKQFREYAIASGGGRMVTTMDRYKADWSIVQRGYEAHVMGNGPLFSDALTAIRQLRIQTGKDDQYLPHWVTHHPENPSKPLATIQDGDVVIFFNFRGDRAIEISLAFTEQNFKGFPRSVFPNVRYAGMMEYDGDLKIPPRYLVAPPQIERTVSEYLVHNGIRQFAISETQKFGHVTYFWNGNNSEPFDPAMETWVNIPSDLVPFDQKPQMKAIEITDRMIQELQSGAYDFLRMNLANGDMVGHTGNFDAAVIAVETVDKCLGKLAHAIDQLDGTLVVTADHGNCDMMYDVDSAGRPILESEGQYKPLVRHTLNPVPFVVYSSSRHQYELDTTINKPGLGNIAATLLMLLGFDKPADYMPSLLKIK